MAHGMRLDHPIFHTPKKAAIQLEELATLANYEHYATGPLPKKRPAWRVFHQPERQGTEKNKSRPQTRPIASGSPRE